MYQLIYRSTARPSLDQHEVSRILNSARRRNYHDELAGLLVFDGTHFLQMIEGEKDDVEAAYARIVADPRHRAPELLSARYVARRQFGDCNMAWCRAQQIDMHLPLIALIDALVGQTGDAVLRGLLRSFAAPDRRAA